MRQRLKLFGLGLGPVLLFLALNLGGAQQFGSTNLLQLKDLTGIRGGNLVASVNADPQTFNRLLAADFSTGTITDLLSGDLVHINRANFEIEPSLASSWVLDKDGRTYTLHLRRGLRFSDGSPFTAEDVIFTLQVVGDPKTGAPIADQLMIDGVFPTCTKVDDYTVRISFPRPVGVGLRGLNSLSILPKARLVKAYQEGTFAKSWDTSAQPSQIVGMGPFRLKEYQRGVKVVLERNPFYWKKDKLGQTLPYLDAITFLIIPDRIVEALRFEAGDIDLLQTLGSENYARLRRTEVKGENKVADLGPGLQFDFLWFNLNAGTNKAGRPYLDPAKRAIFEKAEFRRAVSYALDRPAMARSILLGLGMPQYGPLSPGNRVWHHPGLPRTDYNPLQAKEMLAAIGLKDSNHDGILEYGANRPLEFTLFTSRGNQRRENIAQVIVDNLARIGIRVDIQLLDPNDLVVRVRNSFDYEAILFGFTPTDVEPGTMASVWYSSGSNHFWHPNQTRPANSWEQEIDSLIGQMVKSLDAGERKKLFFKVQEIWSREMPAIPTVSSSVLVAWKSKVGNLRPSILAPNLWWNADELTLQAR